jgi:hypothetical protein
LAPEAGAAGAQSMNFSHHRQQTATGYITAVQEERFRLHTDREQELLLTARDTARLQELHRAHAHVRVTYSGQPNLDSGVAKSIKELR